MGRRSEPENYNGSTELTDPKHEMFCVLFNTNTMPHFWANGQNSYEFAYGHTDRIEKIEDNIEGLEELLTKPKKARKGKSLAAIEREIKIARKSIQKIRRDCSRSASRLLMNELVKRRSGFLLNNLAKDIVVDQELAFLIQQRDNPNVKMQAIEHYNRKEMRIRDRLDIKHTFDPVKTIRMHPSKATATK